MDQSRSRRAPVRRDQRRGPVPNTLTPIVADVSEEASAFTGDTQSSSRHEVTAVIMAKLQRRHVHRSFWAFCQVADIDSLGLLAQESKRSIEYVEEQCGRAIDQWYQRAAENGSSSSSQSRNQRDVVDTLERDGSHCLLTNVSGHSIQVCHIYPHSALKRKGGPQGFWKTLEMFWSPERIQSWQSAISRNGHLDGCHNMLTLQSNMHANWAGGAFALKPLAPNMDADELDGRSMRVQFFWQPHYDENELSDTVELSTASKLSNPTSFHTFNENWRVHPSDQSNQTVEIRNGLVFTFTTHDQARLPLPSRDLLEMQWMLHRVLALRGAAEDVEKHDQFEHQGAVMSTRKWVSIEEWRCLPRQVAENVNRYAQGSRRAYRMLRQCIPRRRERQADIPLLEGGKSDRQATGGSPESVAGAKDSI